MTAAEQLADELAALRDALASVRADDSGVGAAADSFRASAAVRDEHMQMLVSAAKALAQATADHQMLREEREASAPSDDELKAAADRVEELTIAAQSGGATSDQIQQASDRFAELLAQKDQAQQRFEEGEKRVADTLDGSTQDLPLAGPLPGTALGALGPALNALSQFKAPGMSSPVADGGLDSGTATAGEDPDTAALLDSLIAGDDGSSSHWGSAPFGGGELEGGAGQTHTSSDFTAPTANGVLTNADVSGRAVNIAPAGFGAGNTGAGTAGIAGGGYPIAPVAPGAGGGAGGVATGKSNDRPNIINEDPDFTGADIDARIATSGGVGHNNS